MLIAILIALIVLWFLGYLNIPTIPIPDVTLFVINGRPISLWDLLIFLLMVTLAGALPRPFREIASVLLILWVLSILGVLAISGLANLILIATIIGLLAYILTSPRT